MPYGQGCKYDCLAELTVSITAPLRVLLSLTVKARQLDGVQLETNVQVSS